MRRSRGSEGMSKCLYFRTTISNGADRTRRLQELHDFLQKMGDAEIAEIWVDYGNYPALYCLLNGQRGWLMYLRHDGDGGFSSRNTTYSGSEKDTLEYYLSNGQRDVYPASWALPRPQVFAAIEWFAAHGRSPPGYCLVQRLWRRCFNA